VRLKIQNQRQVASIKRLVFLGMWLSFSSLSFAAITDANLGKSIVSLQVFDGREVRSEISGFVVQADRFNGYIVTNAESVSGADSLTVTVPGTGGQLVAQVLRTDLSSDYALLKINGLDLPSVEFSLTEPISGEVVWSAARAGPDVSVSMSKGLLRNSFKITKETTGWYQHTAASGGIGGSVLLNECGHVLGLNFTQPASDGAIRALDLTTLRNFLSQQNVKINLAKNNCVSEVVRAKEKAELASAEASRAQSEAQKAQSVARDLEKQLNASKQSNSELVRQTRIALERADVAIRKAEQAQAKADDTRRELEEKTVVLREETQILLKAFEAARIKSEERFQDLLASQQESAESRERILVGFSGALIVLIGIVMFFARIRVNGVKSPLRTVSEAGGQPKNTQLHRGELSEYVLDGRDDDGIRYLLRISGDQMVDQSGVIIGRNPKDSPYIINHADVSRKHARIKVENNRVFIEDLGSTNGTSVNGQSIDDKGLVSVNSGDQIIIGSVVMKLRVMEG
jgi:hypothetical protein